MARPDRVRCRAVRCEIKMLQRRGRLQILKMLEVRMRGVDARIQHRPHNAFTARFKGPLCRVRLDRAQRLRQVSFGLTVEPDLMNRRLSALAACQTFGGIRCERADLLRRENAESIPARKSNTREPLSDLTGGLCRGDLFWHTNGR